MRRMERRIQLEQVLPEKIEDRSFEIISEELMERFPGRTFRPEEEPVI